MLQLFWRALQITVVVLVAAVVITEGQRTEWPPKLFAAVLAMIAVTFILNTLSLVIRETRVLRHR
jgi:hypothetical protein